jgi:hypothetical protein
MLGLRFSEDALKNESPFQILYGEFFWNSEGPFRYPVTNFYVLDEKGIRMGFVTVTLHTGNPGKYEISGSLVYKNPNTGKVLRTGRVSAGVHEIVAK